MEQIVHLVHQILKIEIIHNFMVNNFQLNYPDAISSLCPGCKKIDCNSISV